MPLFADSSVPGSAWNVSSPGVHASTTPVLRLRERILEGLAGKNEHGRDERAVGECSDAVGAMPSGVSTQPTQVAEGAAPLASSSKTSIDSRPPWFVA